MRNRTPTKRVLEIGRMSFSGNIIPSLWFNHIKFPGGKSNLNAVVILSEIVYWYRPREVKDERTGAVIGYEKKFDADLLQRSYDSFASQFGLSKEQCRDALECLVKLGVVVKEPRTIEVNGTKLSNVMFWDINPDRLADITYPPTTGHPDTYGDESRYPPGTIPIPVGNNPDTNTENTQRVHKENKDGSFSSASQNGTSSTTNGAQSATPSGKYKNKKQEASAEFTEAMGKAGVEKEKTHELVYHFAAIVGKKNQIEDDDYLLDEMRNKTLRLANWGYTSTGSLDSLAATCRSNPQIKFKFKDKNYLPSAKDMIDTADLVKQEKLILLTAGIVNPLATTVVEKKMATIKIKGIDTQVEIYNEQRRLYRDPEYPYLILNEFGIQGEFDDKLFEAMNYVRVKN